LVWYLEYVSGVFQEWFGFSPSFLPSGFCNIGVSIDASRPRSAVPLKVPHPLQYLTTI
jgi:hypothetical protein